jgi:hypothetical protein
MDAELQCAHQRCAIDQVMRQPTRADIRSGLRLASRPIHVAALSVKGVKRVDNRLLTPDDSIPTKR